MIWLIKFQTPENKYDRKGVAIAGIKKWDPKILMLISLKMYYVSYTGKLITCHIYWER